MDLTSRPARQKDFDQFYDSCYPNDRNNPVLRGVMEHEWNALLNKAATFSIVIEDKDRPQAERVVGCGQSAFITESFARLLREGQSEGLPPWVNVHATKALPDGSQSLLDSNGIARANAGSGLVSLMTRWMVARRDYVPDDVMKLRYCLLQSFSTWLRGYKLKEIMLESIGEAAKQEALLAGFQVLNSYEDYYKRYPPPPPHTHPCLLHLTREAARDLVGTTAHWIFAHTPPRHNFNFSEKEQRVLRLAMTHATNRDIAGELNCSVARVNQHWQSIYRRAEHTLGLGLGGEEKKSAIIRYLWDHLEELCPTDTSSHRRERPRERGSQ